LSSVNMVLPGAPLAAGLCAPSGCCNCRNYFIFELVC
jgi:hypothetical protein